MTVQVSEANKQAPVSIRKRLLLGGGILVLMLVALGVGENLLQRSRDAGTLKRALEDLDASEPGWRWEDLEAARAQIPDDRNSALTVVNARRLLHTVKTNFDILPRIDELPKNELLDAEGLAVLERELKANETAVIEARKLADMPFGRYRLDLARNPLLTLLPNQQDVRAVFGLMQYDALHLVHKGKPAESLRSCRALFNAACSLGDEPIVITQLIRFSGALRAANAVERTLALGEGADRDLAAIAQKVEEEEAHQGCRLALRGERASMHILFRGLADGSLALTDFPDSLGNLLELREKYAPWTFRALVRREHPQMLALMNRAIEITQLNYHEQPAAEDDLKDEIRKFKAYDSLIAQLVPSVIRIAETQRRKAALMRCLFVLLAVERYRLKEGAWPVKLEELTPKLLKAVPLDPFDGKPLRYKKLAEGVVVYSVGTNGIDDGGALETRLPSGQMADLGYRLWDVKHRRQPPPKTK